MTDQIPADQSTTPPPANPYGAAPVQEAQPSKAKSVGKSILKRIVGFGIAIVVLAVGGFIWRTVTGDVSTAKVGDCITNTVKDDASDAKVVDCTDATAANKVVGIVEGKQTRTQFMASDNPCTAFETAETAIFLGKSSGTGDVWCLEPIK